MSSLTSSAVSSLTAGAGLFLLADGLAALKTASRGCDSEREYLATLPYSMYYYSEYEFKNCLLTSVSLTVSSFRLSILSCEISVSLLCIISAFSAVCILLICMPGSRQKKKIVVERVLSADCKILGMHCAKSKWEIKKGCGFKRGLFWQEKYAKINY